MQFQVSKAHSARLAAIFLFLVVLLQLSPVLVQAQNLGGTPATNKAVQGQTAAQPEIAAAKNNPARVGIITLPAQLARFSSPFSNMDHLRSPLHPTIAWTSFHSPVTLKNANAENTSGMNGFLRE